MYYKTFDNLVIIEMAFVLYSFGISNIPSFIMHNKILCRFYLWVDIK